MEQIARCVTLLSMVSQGTVASNTARRKANALLVAQTRVAVIAVALALLTTPPAPVDAAEVVVRARTTLAVDVQPDGTVAHLTGTLRDNIFQGLGARTLTVWAAPTGWERVDDGERVHFERDSPPSRATSLLQETVTTDRNGRFSLSTELTEGKWVVGVDFDGGPFHLPVGYHAEVEFERWPIDVVLDAPVATPIWGPCPLTVRALGAERAVPGRDIEIQFAGVRMGDPLITDENGAAEVVIDPILQVGYTVVRAVFRGDAQYAAAQVEREVLVYNQAAMRVELTLVDERELRVLVIEGSLDSDQGPLAAAPVRVTIDTLEVDEAVETSDAGVFSLAVPLGGGEGGDITVHAEFRPTPEADDQFAVASQQTIEVKRPAIATLGAWARPAAAVLCVLLVVALVTRRVAVALETHKKRNPKPAPPGRAAPPGLVEYGGRVHTKDQQAIGVAGTVRDADTGDPVGGAEVLGSAPSGGERPRYPVTTRGKFRIAALPPGRHTLRFEAPGHVSTEVEVIIPHRGRYTGLEVFLVSVRSWVRHHYDRLTSDMALDDARSAVWGWLTPRQIEEATARIYTRFAGAKSPFGGAQFFNQRLSQALAARSEGAENPDAPTLVLEALTLLVEEVYYSRRAYREDMVEVCKALVAEIRRMASGVAEEAA